MTLPKVCFDQWLSPREAGEHLGVIDETVRRWVKQHPAIGQRLGGRWLVSASAIEQIAAGVPLDQVR